MVLESSLAEYIAHSARNYFPDFERPLLAPQPTDLDDKKRKLCEISCSFFLSHQNVNTGTFSKTLCKQKGVCGPLKDRLRPLKDRLRLLKGRANSSMFYCLFNDLLDEFLIFPGLYLSFCMLFHLVFGSYSIIYEFCAI